MKGGQLLRHQDEKPHIMLKSLLYYICTVNGRVSVLVSSKQRVLEARKRRLRSGLVKRDRLQMAKKVSKFVNDTNK